MDKEGKEFTNGINKSDLAHDLLKLLNKDDILVSLDDYYRSPAVQSDAIMIDFMGVIRRRTAVELRGVETFGDLFKLFLGMIFHFVEKVLKCMSSLKTTGASAR